MIVGFIITDFRGHQEEAIKFIQKVCILSSPDVAENIVKAGTGINIFSYNIEGSDINSQPFATALIEVAKNKIIVASAVNFPLEIMYNGSIVRLKPTEYITVDVSEAEKFLNVYDQDLVRFYPDYYNGKEWILDEAVWEDANEWQDTEKWEDTL